MFITRISSVAEGIVLDRRGTLPMLLESRNLRRSGTSICASFWSLLSCIPGIFSTPTQDSGIPQRITLTISWEFHGLCSPTEKFWTSSALGFPSVRSPLKVQLPNTLSTESCPMNIFKCRAPYTPWRWSELKDRILFLNWGRKTLSVCVPLAVPVGSAVMSTQTQSPWRMLCSILLLEEIRSICKRHLTLSGRKNNHQSPLERQYQHVLTKLMRIDPLFLLPYNSITSGLQNRLQWMPSAIILCSHLLQENL